MISDRAKEIIVKTIIIVNIAMLLFLVLGFALLSLWVPAFADSLGKNINGWFRTYIIVWLFTGGLMAVTTACWGIPNKRKKAYRMALKFDNYAEYENWLAKEIKEYFYEEHEFSEDNTVHARIFMKHEGRGDICRVVWRLWANG